VNGAIIQNAYAIRSTIRVTTFQGAQGGVNSERHAGLGRVGVTLKFTDPN
jgi:hypothetical protein